MTDGELYECINCGAEVTEDESEAVCTYPGTLETPPEYETLCKKCYGQEEAWADEMEKIIREGEEAYDETVYNG